MANPKYYATYRNGNSGPDVSLIQIWLNGLHNKYSCIKSLTVDGKFGPKTQNAVQCFQCVTGLSMDGVVGPNTWNGLYDHYAAEVAPGEQYPGTNMVNGSRGATVKSAQERLNVHGHQLNADGIMGTKTVQAVRDFQQDHGLSVDGVIGVKTWAALY